MKQRGEGRTPSRYHNREMPSPYPNTNCFIPSLPNADWESEIPWQGFPRKNLLIISCWHNQKPRPKTFYPSLSLLCFQVHNLFESLHSAQRIHVQLRAEVCAEETGHSGCQRNEYLHGHLLVSQLLCLHPIESGQLRAEVGGGSLV